MFIETFLIAVFVVAFLVSAAVEVIQIYLAMRRESKLDRAFERARRAEKEEQ